MSAGGNIKIVQDYLAGRGPELMAEDATFHDLSQPAPLRGRAAIAGMFHHLYVEAFPGASAEFRNWVASGDAVVLEFTFRGVNSGPFMGRPPTGKKVEVPMCVVYEVQDGLIRRARLYYNSSDMA